MSGQVWGETNTSNFKMWADRCQQQVMSERNLKLNTMNNYSNISTPIAISAKESLLDIIQKRKKVSVMDLYRQMNPEMCANPTTKELIMRLYYENKLRMESTTSREGRETSFTIVFDNRAVAENKVIKTATRTFTQQQSNVEDVFNRNWKSSGRRLDFDKIERPTNELNISLKKEKPRNPISTNQKPVQDVRQLLNKTNIKATVAPSPEKPQRTLPKIESRPVPPMFPEIKINIPEIKINPVQVPEIKPIKVETPKMHFDNNLEFAGLSVLELYLLEMFFLDYSLNEKDKGKKEYLKTNSKLCKTKGDIAYLEQGKSKNGFVKFILGVLSITIVMIPVLVSYSKNKVRSTAKKEYLSIKKRNTFDQIKNNFKNKYPRVVKD